MRHRADLIVANLHRVAPGDEKVVVEDWNSESGEEVTITFDRERFATPLAEAEAAFALARRHDRGSEIVEAALAACKLRVRELAQVEERIGAEGAEEALAELRAAVAEIGGVKLPPAPDEEEAAAAEPGRRGKQQESAETEPDPLKAMRGSWTGRCFLSPRDVPIFVGRSSKENEELSLRLAREPDVWMHARDSPGAHVVLRLSQVRRDGGGASAECLQAAADLAILFSPKRSERRARVTVASPKGIRKPRGAPTGTVRILHEKRSLLGAPARGRDIVAKQKGKDAG